MIVTEILKVLDGGCDYSENTILDNDDASAIHSALQFLKAYQLRVEQLEKALSLVSEARKVVAGSNSFGYMQEIRYELDVLRSIQEEGNSDLIWQGSEIGWQSKTYENEKIDNKGYDHNSKDKPSRLSFQTFA